MKHIMLDLETMGTDPYSAIISIGAVYFDLRALDPILATFEVGIELESAVSAGLRMDPSTVMWWLSEKQDAARKHWLGEPRIELQAALHGFADWLGIFSQHDERAIWGNGADFDNLLLRQAYKALNIDAPWSYRGNRCFRTLKGLVDEPNELKPSEVDMQDRVGMQHTALYDAVYQTMWMERIVDVIGNVTGV